MKKHVLLAKMLMIMTFTGLLTAFTSFLSAQTITTTLLNNNGSSVIVFSVVNTNPSAMVLTDIGSIAGVTNTYTCHLYARSVAYDAPTGAPPAITAANGFSVVASNNSLALTGNTNTSHTGANAVPFITGMNYIIPANSQIQFALQLATGANLPAFTTTAGSLRYSTVGVQTCTFSSGGIELRNCTGYGYGGTMGAPTISPRGFVGFMTFVPAADCAGTPNAGTATISSAAGCFNAPFNLNATGVSFGTGLSYQWQTSVDGNAPWNNVVGGTSVSFNTSTPTTAFYRLRSYCSISNEENFSNAVSYTASGGQCDCGAYPAIFASSTADEDISNVTVGAMNNSSTCATVAPGAGSIQNRYSNYTTSVAGPSEVQGSTVSFSLTQTTCGGVFGNGFQIYVDWNQDGDFLDAGEQVYNQPNAESGNHTKTGTFVVPMTAAVGTTRMRVVNVETTFPTAINYAHTAYTWGETEDYCFTVIEAVPCTGTPNPGNTLSTLAAPCGTDNFTLSLQNATPGSGVTYQWQTSANGIDWTNAVGAPNAGSWTLSHGAATWYRCIVTCGSESTASNGVNVGLTVCYCTPAYTSGTSAGDLISAVSIAGTTLNNNVGFTAGQPSYLNFYNSVLPNQTGTLNAGTSYTVTVSTGEWGDQGIAAWIDFNGNGLFEASEKIGTSATVIGSGYTPGQVNATASFTISLPCNPTPGDYRMRIRGVYLVNGPLIDPCASYTWGQTHDYKVTVAPPPPCPMISGLAASGITAFTANLNWNQGCAETAWDIHISTSPTPPVGAPDVVGHPSTNYSATGLTPQTLYYAHVRANCGGGNGESEYLTISFTTLPVPPPCATNVLLTPTPNCANYDITLTYDAVPSATGYNIFVGTAPGVYNIANPFNAGTNTTIFLQNPAINTTYYFVVAPYNIAGDAVGCSEISITTGSQQCACIPVYTSGKTAGDLISNVVIPGTTLSNNSGTAQVNPAFTYFTGQPNYTANLVQGGSYNVTVEIGTWGNQHIRAWVDYNDNGVFEASESIGNSIIAPGQGFGGPYPPAIFPINLSLSAPLGTHRMRIRGVWQSVADPVFAANIDPCASYGFGETEDYDITIVAPVTTQLQANFCNISNVTMDMPIRAINVNAPQYRFRIVGPNNGGQGWVANTFILDRPSRDMKFAFVPGSLWGSTYAIDVAVGDGFGNYGPYGAVCNVSLVALIPTTQLQASDCGAVNVDPTVNLLANTITSATGYRYQVNGPGVAQNTVITKTMGGGAMRKLKMQEVAGIILGETYTVEVAIRDAAGNWGAYGNPCSVTLMGAPNVVINNNIEMVQNRNLSEAGFGVSASHNPFTTDFGLQVLNANDTETINVSIYDMSGKLIERHAVNPMDIEAAKFGSNLASGMYMVEVRQGSNQALVRQIKN